MARTVKQIEDHLDQVLCSLHDSQEHSQIVRLEMRSAELREELRKAKSTTAPRAEE